jgi:hypothetical protein
MPRFTPGVPDMQAESGVPLLRASRQLLLTLVVVALPARQ